MTSRLERASRARKQILDLQGREDALLQALLSCRSLVKGSVYKLETRCGKPSCFCARGERHGAMVLSWSQGGRTKLVAVRASDVERLIKLTGEYRKFRQARARLVKLQKELQKAVDGLEAALRDAAPKASKS